MSRQDDIYDAARRGETYHRPGGHKHEPKLTRREKVIICIVGFGILGSLFLAALVSVVLGSS